jgi:photosystem II stability/assembly factor-like uncharacterized protein
MIRSGKSKSARHTILALLALSFMAIAARAQQLDQKLFGGMQWRMIGPHRGGRVLAVAGVPGKPNLFYFGGVAGGVWRTTNVGETWEPIFDEQHIASIGAIAVAPSDPNIIYVGSGEADMRSDISFGDGVYRSTDGGQTWRNVGLSDSRHVARIIVDPRNPGTLLVAALGRAYGPNTERGVFRSTNGGTSWEKVLSKDADTGALDLCFDPENSKIVYAALWQTRRPAWSSYPPLGGAGSGLYKSTDGGSTWSEIRGHGLPSGPLGRIGISAAPGGSRVYALIDAKYGGMYRSDDAGENWQRVSADGRLWGRGWYFGGVTADPRAPDTIYVANVALYRSTDGGRTFIPIKGAPGGDDYHSLWIDPVVTARMILGCDQGAIITVDGGKTWSSWFNQPTAQFYHVSTDNQFPYYVYGAQQDSGTAAVASRGDFGSITFRDWFSVGAGESGYIAPSPADSNIVFGGDTYGTLWRFDKHTGQTQNISPEPWVDFGADITTRKYRFTWTSPLVFSPQDPRTLYYGSQYVLRTTDEGKHWTEISPDLTGTDIAAARAHENEPLSASNAKARGFGVVYTIAPSPLAASQIWIGTDTGLIHLTRDDGQTWTNITPPGLTEWSKISMVEASPHDAATAYAAVDRHRLDDYGPHILRTHDFGRTWREISLGIAPNAYVHSVREDLQRKGMLFAGTELGIYISFDEGDHWQPLQLNLPVVPIHDLTIHENDLVVATHGRSFWILDDITPLRQLTPEIAAKDVYLFAPETAIRVRRSVNVDTPLPPEVPAGQNPPAGAILDYFLKAEQAGEVTLEIHDTNGKLVRRFSSADKPFEPPQPPAITGGWFPPVSVLSNEPGMHRFVWDLRYAHSALLEPDYSMSIAYGMNTPPIPEATLALPGEYEVRLNVAGQTLTQPLELKMDPRVNTSLQDLAAMHSLSRNIAAALDETAVIFRQAHALRERLESLQKTTAGDAQKRDVAAAAADLLHKVMQLEDSRLTPLQSEHGIMQTHLALAGLAMVVESADRGPTAQAAAFFEQLRKELNQEIARWQELMSKDLSALNSLLRKRNLAVIEIPRENK